ncbi:hypothetical protein GMRT_11573 [Giardia muris]|uniref:Uncharacterized protein n=1 Tax=Giardia muris TaxID=5742 RepID=A0A4Z1SWY0_GIAMU|nr:hypothetical protein GMRT_21135 [Giardia muris]TNJ30350.1 hypothetical protein GMRT_11573 [Giardia muris]|eukprot:TNJ30312.1 hypothetical protein GMRT_21135 [Giardia muris]
MCTSRTALETPLRSRVGRILFMVTEDAYEALRRADRYLCNPRASDEERHEAAVAVLTTARGCVLDLARDTYGARMLEEALQLATPGQVATILAELLPSFLAVARTRNGSHVCQTCVALASRASRSAPMETDPTGLGALYRSLVEGSVLPELEGFADSFASYTLRTLLRVEAGIPPEDDRRGRRKHASEDALCVLYGPRDPFHHTAGPYLGRLLIGVHAAWFRGADILGVCRSTELSVLVQEYARAAATCWDELSLPAECTPSVLLRRLLGLQVDTDDLDSSAVEAVLTVSEISFAFEELLKATARCDPSFAGQAADRLLEATVLGGSCSLSSTAEIPASSHAIATAIEHASSPAVIQRLLVCYTAECQLLLELDNSRFIPSVLRVAGSAVSELRNFLLELIRLTGAGDRFARALLLPGQPLVGPFELSFSFTSNPRHRFTALQTVVPEGEPIPRELLDARREEHARRTELEQEAFFGTRFVRRQGTGPTKMGVWQTGKQILIAWFALPSRDLSELAATSLLDSFPTAKDLHCLIEHPAGCAVLEAFVHSEAVGLELKIRLLMTLRPAISDLASNKLGCTLLRALHEALLGPADGVPEDIVADARTVLAGEINTSTASVSRFGRDLCRDMNLKLFSRDPRAWLRASRNRSQARRAIHDLFSAPVGKHRH